MRTRIIEVLAEDLSLYFIFSKPVICLEILGKLRRGNLLFPKKH